MSRATDKTTAKGDGAEVGSADAGGAEGKPINRRKAKKAADFERRERRRLAEERIEAERARHRADNRAARERDAAERAERQRAAEVARDAARRQEAEQEHQPTEVAGAYAAPVDTADRAKQEAAWLRAEAVRQADAAKAAARERKRQAEAERRAARAERARREAEEKATRRRQRDEERRAEREATQARVRGTDPYVVLGLPSTATDDEIARTYRRLARAHHPDLNQDATPRERAAREAEMKRINVAYGLLGDPQRRRAYDRQHRRP